MKSMWVQRGYICLPSLCLHYVELNKKIVCTDRRYGNRNHHHMRRSAGIRRSRCFSAGRPGGLITEIAWNPERLEAICRWRDRCYGIKLFILVLIQGCGKNYGHYTEKSVHGINRTLFAFVSIYTIYP